MGFSLEFISVPEEHANCHHLTYHSYQRTPAMDSLESFNFKRLFYLVVLSDKSFVKFRETISNCEILTSFTIAVSLSFFIPYLWTPLLLLSDFPFLSSKRSDKNRKAINSPRWFCFIQQHKEFQPDFWINVSLLFVSAEFERIVLLRLPLLLIWR